MRLSDAATLPLAPAWEELCFQYNWSGLSRRKELHIITYIQQIKERNW